MRTRIALISGVLAVMASACGSVNVGSVNVTAPQATNTSTPDTTPRTFTDPGTVQIDPAAANNAPNETVTHCFYHLTSQWIDFTYDLTEFSSGDQNVHCKVVASPYPAYEQTYSYVAGDPLAVHSECSDAPWAFSRRADGTVDVFNLVLGGTAYITFPTSACTVTTQ